MDTIPSEVITQILKYLSFEDRKRVALINRKWYYASLHPTLIKKEWFNYKQNVADICKPTDETFYKFKQILLKSERPILNVKMTIHHLHSSFTIDDIGSRIVSLILVKIIDFTDFLLDSISNSFNVLETLTLKTIFGMELTIKPRKPLLKLRILTIHSFCMTDKNFNIFMQCCPNLEDIGLIQCNIQEDNVVIKRLYPDWEHRENFNSDVGITYLGVVNCLKNNKYINKLRLQNCKIVTYLPTHIKLKCLTLKISQPIFCSENYLIGIEQLSLTLGKLTSLNELKIKFLPCCLLMAVSQLQNLKCLKIHFTINSSQKCNVIKLCVEKFVKSLSNMKNLKKLSINTWSLEQMTNPIPEIPDCTLNLLTSLDCFFKNRLQIVNLNKNIKSLRIQNGDILTSSDLHFIFSNFINLVYLCIDNCKILDDNIFLGLPISNLKGLISLHIDADISYSCLHHIKLLNLKYLTIRRKAVDIRLYQKMLCETSKNDKIPSVDKNSLQNEYYKVIKELKELLLALRKNNAHNEIKTVLGRIKCEETRFEEIKRRQIRLIQKFNKYKKSILFYICSCLNCSICLFKKS